MGQGFCGLDWYRGDFHVHTPFSRCYQEHGVTAGHLLAAAGELDFMVVADHNTFDGYLHLLEHREQLKPVLFPGVELKVPRGYAGLSLVVILSPNFSPEELELFLRETGLSPAAKGDPGIILPAPLTQVAEVVRKYDGIALWTKVHTPEGILAGVDGRLRDYIWGLNWPVTLVDLGHGEEAGAYPAVWGSNAHRVKEIGGASTLVKLEALNFAGLKFALQDPASRLAPGSTPQYPAHPRILSLRVSGGFLAGQEFIFNPGLNCVIGARGTGKSTLLKLLGFALGMPGAEGLDTLLGDGEVEVSLLDSQGQRLRMCRRINGESRVYDRLGRPANANLREYALFFGQGEIERVVLDPQFQLELLDSLWDSAQSKRARAVLAGALAENGDTLAETNQALDDLQEQLAGRAALEQRMAELRSLPLADIQARLAERDRELQVLAAAEEMIRQNLKLISRLPQRGGITNHVMQKALERTTAAIADLTTVWEQAAAELSACRREVEARHRQLEEEYRTLLGGCSDSRVRDLLKEREHIQAELVRLEPLTVRMGEISGQGSGLERQRRELLKKWTSLGEEIFLRRRSAAAEINGQLKPSLRVEVAKSALTLPYRRFLGHRLGSLGNSAVRALENKVPPGELSEILLQGDAAALAKLSGLAMERCRRILGLLSGRKDLLELEALEVPDLVQVYLREGETEKAGAALSTGQRCTAVLPLLLAPAGGPLIIDQPEDQLDNAYVYATLVRRLRELKGRRQFIFATHNPNIPVLADAEQNFVLESDGVCGWVRAHGAVENSSIKDLIQVIMEGGKDAFQRRAQRYGQLAP